MVAVISGNGLGLGNTSLTQLGQSQGGSPSLGQAGNRSYVNAATGNLILQSNDEGLLFDGLPLNVLRTYNSLGQLNGNDGWTYGFSRSVNGLTGTLNSAGSTITRNDDDGSSVVYTYNATLGVYQSTDQSGAIDTLSWNATSSTWTWTDAASTTQETYNATGQLTALTDTSSGASYSFSYNNGQLSQIVANDGDTLLFGYNTSHQLISLSIQEVPPGQSTAVTRQAVSYGYDTQGRLTSVTTTLDSDTDSTSASYTTTYAYQGTTDLISSVTQSDGTTVSYTYNANNQIASITTGSGSGSAAQTLSLSYGTQDTTVTDGLGNATQYLTNAQGQLTSVIAPAVNGSSPTTTYTYDANGNLLTSTDPNGAVTTYQYDANGNLLSVEDGVGNTVSYTYNVNDQVTSKTTYTVPAQGQVGQSGYVAPSGAETTYYVYNATNQLAYTIDALGNVSENDYTPVNGLSELTTTRQYLGATYSTSSNSPSNPPTLAQLQSWVASSAVQSTLSQSTRTDFTYDVRGQLATQNQYDTVDSNGNGVLTNGTVITTTTYDAQGRLLQTSAETGANRTSLQTTTYAYDGLGRVLSKTDPLGNLTSYVYTDSASTIAITQANGLTTTQVRNSAGQLLSSTQSASGQTSRSMSYLYNADGQQIAAVDPAGNVTYTYYNADGEVAGTVDGDGNVTAYTYDADGHVVQTTQYATPINTSGWFSSGALTGSYPASLPAPAGSASDRITTSLYNAAGHLVATIDPAGNVTTTAYDGAGHTLATTQYATPLTSAQRSALGMAPTLSVLQADLASNASNRTTLAIYDADGRAVASIDAQGYVTLTTYNAAGEAVLRTAYATALTASQLSSLGDTPTLAALQADLTPSAQDQTTRTYDDGAGRAVAVVDAGGYLTTTAYDETTHTTTRYATALTGSQLSALTGTESVATLVGLLGSSTANEQSSVTTNADGEVTSRTAIDGTVTTYTYNSAGQVLSTTVTPASGQGSARTTAATYDAFGDTLTRTDAASATTTYVYNALGQQVEATDALGNSSWSYYDADGKLLYTLQGQPSGGARNALGNVTAYQYNAFGEVTSTTTYAAPLTLITSGSNSGTSINPTGATAAQVATAIASLSAVSGDANATSTTTYTLDGQVASVTDANGYQTATTYDAFGDVLSVQQQLSQPGSALSASNSTLTDYAYDNRGERLSATDGAGTSVARTTFNTYDAFGRVTSTTDGNGNSITYSYDALGRQVSSGRTVQGSARSTQTTYDAFGHVLSETDALGNVTTFSYNLATHTTTTTTPLGVTMTTVKDAFGDTVSVTDGGGNTTTYTYDADGRLLTTTTPLGEVSTNRYDADGDLIQTTDATGHVVTTTYNASGKVLTQTVDPNGLNLTTTYSYDAQGRTLSVTDPMGAVTTYGYDADGHSLTTVVDATGVALTTTYTYDGAGKTLTVTTGANTSAAITTQYVYDNLERLSQTIVAPGTLNLTTGYAYDANNNLISKTDANGNVTRYVYDEANEKIFTIDPTGAVTQTTYDADGHVTTTRTYATVLTASQLSALGNMPTPAAVSAMLTASSADRLTQRAYNADGQVVYQIDGGSVTQLSYNAAGQVTQTHRYAIALSASLSPTATAATVAAAVTPSGNDLFTTTAYNADGQAVYAIDGAGDVTQTLYDAAGRVTQTIVYATPLNGAQVVSLGSTPTTAQISALITTSASDRTTATSYDSAGRAVYSIDATGAVTQTSYDADGRVTSTHAYATALTAAQRSALGSAPTPAQIAGVLTASASDAITYSVYDSAGELRYHIDPMGYVTETRYDASGRAVETLAYANAINLSGESSALQAGTALGWLAHQVGANTGNPDSSAQATLTLYDAAGHVAFTVQQNGTVAQVTGYTYDANGNVTAKSVYGSTLGLNPSAALSAQFTTASVAGAVATFTAKETTTTVYDADNRAVYTIDALGDVTQTSYDAFGRVIETQQYATPITLPGTINTSTVAAAVSAAGTSGARLTTTTYDPRGDVLTTGDALGTHTTYTYNALGQKLSETNRDGASWTYSYDTAGRLIQTQSPPVTVGSEGNSGSLSNQYLYTTNTYDAFGDLVSTAQGYGASASAITTVSTTSYTYDALGRRIQTTDALGHTTTTTYNALGQAVVAKDANGNLSYKVYDADGHLLGSVDGNGYVTAYTYDAYGNVLSTTQYATGLSSAISGWNPGQPLSAAQLQQGVVTSSNDRTTTTTYNQLNQKTQVVQPSITYDLSMGVLGGNATTGSPTTVYTYDAYGNVTSVAQLVQGAYTSGSTTTPAIWETTYTYYDALNRAVMVVTPTGTYTSPQGYVTTTAYTAFGQVSSTIAYAQAISTSGITTGALPGLPGNATPASGADRITSYTYDAIGRVSSEVDTGGYNSSTGYTSASVGISYTYNGEGQVLTKTVNGATTTTAYDALGRVLSITAPARQSLVGNWQSLLESTPGDDLTTAALYASVSPVTSYVYDALGHAVSTTIAAGGLTQQSSATYNALGQLTQSTDANGTVRSITYDPNGNVLTQSYTLGGSTVTTMSAYDADNQLLSTAVQRSKTGTYDSYTQQKYDAFGEVIAKGDNHGYEAAYTYNAAGQQTSAPDSHGAIHLYGYDLVGNLVVDRSTVTGGASAVWTHNTYNLGNQVVSQVTPASNAASGEGGSVTTSYDRWGNVTAKTDANGTTTTYQYDSQNHLIEETQANVLVVSAAGVYSWVSPTQSWAYNVKGQLTQSTDANTNVTLYTYDAAGNQTVVKDATGATTTTAYDALGRAVAIQTPPAQTATGTLANITVTTYDNLNQVIAQGYFQLNANGTARTLVTQNTYTLDANGDRIQTTDALGNSIQYSYDSQHRVLSSTTPLNETTRYVYDVNGNLIQQTDADGYTQSWTYNYFKQAQTHTDESGATYTYTYDANSGLMTKETSNWTPTGPSGATTSTLTYSYDADGALASLTDAMTSGSSTVTSTYSYGYDANGNETLETISTQDGGGNAVSTQIVIGYDSHNRLQEVTDENGAGTSATMRTVYVYDADGNRRAVFASSAYDAQGTSSTPIAATPIPLTAGAPTLSTALANQTVSASGSGFAALSYAVAGSFSDPLGMGLTYTATGMPSWLSLNGTSGVFSGTPPVPTAAGSYTVTVTAMDVLGRSVSGSFTVTVPKVNPVFSGSLSNQTANPGAAWSYQAPAATDANGYSVSYSVTGNLPPGVSFNASTRTFSGTPSTGGAYSLTYTATSSAGTTVSASFTITVPYVAPVFTGSVSNQTVQPGGTLNYQAPAATDANGYGVTYTAAGLPSGITFNASTRTFSGSLTGNGSWIVTYTASPSTGSGGSVSQSFTITVPTVTPVFSGGMANQTATATLAMNAYTAPAATDANGASLTYSASGMPAGVSFNASTRTFSGTPSTAGSYTITYTATASNGAVASATFSITVNPASAPVVTGGSDQANFTFGVSSTAQPVTFSNPMGRALSYSLTNNSVPGLSINSSSGALVYTPPAGTNTNQIDTVVTITARDSVDGLSCAQDVKVIVSTGHVMTTAAPAAATPTATMTMAATPAATPAPSPTPNVQADWFTYDADNRVLVADGSLQGGTIIANQGNTNSGANVYDAAGNVIQYTSTNSAGKQTIQKNYYNALNQLAMVQTTAPGGTTFGAYESRSYDADGRLIQDVIFNAPGSTETTTSGSFSDAGWVRTDTIYTYNKDGELIDQSEYAEESAQALINQYGAGNVSTSAYATQDKTAPTSLPTVGATTDGALYLYTENSYTAASGYGYDADGNVLGYHTITGGSGTVLNATPTAGTVGNQNAYIKQNGLLLATTTQVPTSGSSTVTTNNTYNDLGELAAATDVVNGVTQTQDMAYTSGGRVLQKSVSSNGSTTTTYYASVNEAQLGSIDTAGNINVLSTTGGFSNGSSGTQSYTVQAGDTLQSLAQAIYGDSNYYYILAQANGLSLSATLTAGMVLHIPQVTTTANSSGTYQPYSAGNVISGSASGMETVAAMLALSVDAIFNQQSAIAQTVAQVEAQAAQEAAIQQQMEQEQAAANEAKQAAEQEQQLAAQAQANAESAQQQAAQAQAAAMQAEEQAKNARLQAASDAALAQQDQLQSAQYIEQAKQGVEQAVAQIQQSQQAAAAAAYAASKSPAARAAQAAQDDLWAYELSGWKNSAAANSSPVDYTHDYRLAVGLGVEARGDNPQLSDAAPPPDGLQGEDSDGIDLVQNPGTRNYVIPGYHLATAGTGEQKSGGYTIPSSLSDLNVAAIYGDINANSGVSSDYSLATAGTGVGDASTDYGLGSFFSSADQFNAVLGGDSGALSNYLSLNEQAAALDNDASNLASDYSSLLTQSGNLDAQASSLQTQSGDLAAQYSSLLQQSSDDQTQSSTDLGNYNAAQSQYAVSQGQLGVAQGILAQLGGDLASLNNSGGDLPAISTSVDVSGSLSIQSAPISDVSVTSLGDTSVLAAPDITRETGAVTPLTQTESGFFSAYGLVNYSLATAGQGGNSANNASDAGGSASTQTLPITADSDPIENNAIRNLGNSEHDPYNLGSGIEQLGTAPAPGSDVMPMDSAAPSPANGSNPQALAQAQNMNASANAGLQWRYGSSDDAVKLFGATANPIQAQTGMEVGAFVLHDAYGYYISDYQSTGPTSVNLTWPDSSELPDGTTVAAWTHTHPTMDNFSGMNPDIYWSQGFNNGAGGYTPSPGYAGNISPPNAYSVGYGDIGYSITTNLNGYVSLPNGDIYKFDNSAFHAAVSNSRQWTVYTAPYVTKVK